MNNWLIKIFYIVKLMKKEKMMQNEIEFYRNNLLITNPNELATVERLTKTIYQALHDIQSPLTCLLILCKYDERLKTRENKINPMELVERINGIVNSIPEAINNIRSNCKENQLISAAISIEKILAQKCYEYSNSDITFRYNNLCSCDSIIKANVNDFERMLSNLLNNAVEACSGKSGVVNINLDKDDNYTHLSIIDNGAGMPDDVKNKILDNVRITANKPNGQGIGFEQIRETLNNSNAKLAIESQKNIGTKITLSFPKIEGR